VLRVSISFSEDVIDVLPGKFRFQQFIAMNRILILMVTIYPYSGDHSTKLTRKTAILLWEVIGLNYLSFFY